MLVIIRGRFLYVGIILALTGGIVAAFILLWGSPGALSLGGVDRIPPPRPAPLYWVLGSEDTALVASTADASISVHRAVISPRHITLFYSVETAPLESLDSVALSPETTLISDRLTKYEVRRVQTLAHYSKTTLGVVSFGPYQLGDSAFKLTIPGLDINTTQFMSGPWEIPVLTRNFPGDSPTAIFNLNSRSSWAGGVVSRGRAGSFVGSSPQGQVATVSFLVGDTYKYFFVDAEGLVSEISEVEYANILDFLGMAQSR